MKLGRGSSSWGEVGGECGGVESEENEQRGRWWLAKGVFIEGEGWLPPFSLAKEGGCPFIDWSSWEAMLAREESEEKHGWPKLSWPAPFLPSTSEQCERKAQHQCV